MHGLNTRILYGQSISDLGRTVRGTIVHDYDFLNAGERKDSLDNAAQRLLLVVRRDNHR